MMKSSLIHIPLTFLRSVRRLLVKADVVPSSPIVALVNESVSSTEASVQTRATRPNIPDDSILHYKSFS
jgi:hypothetical protein